MSDIEKAWAAGPSRRNALVRMAGFVAASPIGVAMAQQDPMEPLSAVRRIPSLSEMRTPFDFEPLFVGNLPALITEYTAHGDGSEFNLRRNRQAFDWVEIVPTRAPIPASQVDLSSELLGVKMKFPMVVAPSSGQNTLHPDGEIGMFRGATAAGMVDILTGAGGPSVTAALKAAPNGTLWSQHYPVQNLTADQRVLEAVQEAGSNCIVVTMDEAASVYQRTLLIRNLGGRASSGASAEGNANGVALAAAAAAAKAAAGGPPVTGSVKYRVSDRRLWYTWGYVDAVRKIAKGKMVIKGIQDAEDAKLAIEHGADAIAVSNHGGRSMDYGPASLEVLPEIVAAVNGRIPILFDSGIRRGADIFKALALGANAVQLGRTARWGLGAFGAVGAQRVFEILQQELVQVCAAAGCAKLSDINKSMVKVNFV